MADEYDQIEQSIGVMMHRIKHTKTSKKLIAMKPEFTDVINRANVYMKREGKKSDLDERRKDLKHYYYSRLESLEHNEEEARKKGWVGWYADKLDSLNLIKRN